MIIHNIRTYILSYNFNNVKQTITHIQKDIKDSHAYVMNPQQFLFCLFNSI